MSESSRASLAKVAEVRGFEVNEQVFGGHPTVWGQLTSERLAQAPHGSLIAFSVTWYDEKPSGMAFRAKIGHDVVGYMDLKTELKTGEKVVPPAQEALAAIQALYHHTERVK